MKMYSRVTPPEEGGLDPGVVNRTNHSRPLPLRLLQIFLLFLALCITFSIISMYMVRFFGVRSAVTTEKSNFVPCYGEHYTLESWIKPPSNLMHTMTDEELLWRASFSSRRTKYPFDRVPKIAFMFLTKGPLPLAPLWERFFKGHEGLFSVYVHSLPSFEARYQSSSVFYRRQVPSKVAEWGRMSMCDAERRLLANSLLDISNEWFILLSESCIPLYNFTTVYDYLSKSRHSFMGSFDDHGPYGRGRYNPNMSPEVNISEWRKGSQWFEVDRMLANSIVRDTKYYPKFKQFCQPACYVDEHYFPTMLTIEAGHAMANRSITWVDWSRGGPHPATFGRSDISEAFLKRIVEGRNCSYNVEFTSMCYLFGRKFAPSALNPLLQLGSKVLGY